MVVLELVTAVVLLAGAGLLGKSLYLLLGVSIGINPDRLLTMDVATPAATYKTDAQTIAVAKRIASRIETLPGVQSVGFVGDGLPLGGNGNTTRFRVLGRPWHGEHEESPERDVSMTYFQTLGAKLIAGRYFNDAEDGSKPRVAIVNQSFATIFPTKIPLARGSATFNQNPTPSRSLALWRTFAKGHWTLPFRRYFTFRTLKASTIISL
jgi:hypothetical protein